MKKLLFALFIIGLSGIAQAKDSIGFIVGDPTGLSLKLWQGKSAAFDFAAGWDLRAKVFDGKLDYQVHNFRLIKVRKGKLPVYFGLGVKVAGHDDIGLGVRVPFGLNYIFSGSPFDFFAEIAPTLSLIPATDFELNGGLGLRFRF